MIAGLPLSFAQPFLLLGLLSLPVLWWLLRVMPPRPRRIEFPPTRLLFDIAPKEETPSHTPWWLTALRLAAAALVILAAAGPIWNPQTGVAGSNAPLGDPARRRLECGVELGHQDQGRGRIDRQCREQPARRGAGSAVRADPRHHHDAGRHRARGAAPVRAKALFDRAGRNLAGDRAFPESNRRQRDRLAVGWRRYRARTGISRRPLQGDRRSRVDDF